MYVFTSLWILVVIIFFCKNKEINDSDHSDSMLPMQEEDEGSICHEE